MKKITILATSIFAAIIANAAAIEWSMTKIADSADASAAAGWIGYILDASKYSEFSTLTPSKLVSYVTENYQYSGKTKSGRGVTFTVTDGSFSANETVSSFLVLFNNEDASSATYYVSTTTSSATIPASGADSSITFGTFTDAMTATGSSGGWVAIPEPTSGLLILLGMAGLALRRNTP